MSSTGTILVRPRSGFQPIDLPELWRYRELLWFLALRDIKVRYKQTLLGAAWAILQPFLTMVVFSIVFGRFAAIPSEGAPYPVFAYCGLLPWQLFAYALTQSSASLVANQRLITKVYFPRLVVPLASLLCGLVDFAVALPVLLGMMLYYGITPPSAAIAAVPLFIILALLTALAAGLWLSAMNAVYRDVQYAVPFLTQFWLFITPVAYPASLVPERFRWLFGLNPMAGVVEGFRWALLGKTRPDVALLALSSAAVIALLLGGLFYFRRMEREIADLV
ncbi:MAG TPA: ABC transporter permease [Candidatus Polarisedimenticolia bacterium]|nr:ABC transporter permease [Candidatus Polarisedimenticolia bacterium]